MKIYAKILMLCLLGLSLASCGGTQEAPVTPTEPTQTLPVANFGDKGYGLYNYDGAGTSFSYNKYQHQLNMVEGSSRAFRILAPYENLFFEVSGLPKTYTKDAEVSFTLYQNITSALSSKSSRKATVYKVEGGTVWLIDNKNVGYVIQQ